MCSHRLFVPFSSENEEKPQNISVSASFIPYCCPYHSFYLRRTLSRGMLCRGRFYSIKISQKIDSVIFKYDEGFSPSCQPHTLPLCINISCPPSSVAINSSCVRSRSRLCWQQWHPKLSFYAPRAPKVPVHQISNSTDSIVLHTGYVARENDLLSSGERL